MTVRGCPGCLHRWQGRCTHDALVGVDEDEREGPATTELGARIEDWLGDWLIWTGRGQRVVPGAPACPGWERR